MQHRASTLREWAGIAQRTREIITDRCGDPNLHIDEVAQAVHVCRRKLQRALDSVGTDYSRELHAARMRRAVKLLGQNWTVAATARMCGLRSHSYFTSIFGQHYGVTPAQFRRAAKINGRLAWRAWKDRVDPVRPGSSEYYRRRRRWSDDNRVLRRLVRSMRPEARSALHEHTPEPWPVARERILARYHAQQNEIAARVERLVDAHEWWHATLSDEDLSLPLPWTSELAG
jgi:AraC-like DNA-binding protein